MIDDVLKVDLNNKTVVVFGGSFNPIHNGHINSIQYLMKKKNFDYCMFVPVNIPVHKDSSAMIDGVHRFQMTCLATQHIENAIVTDIELKRGGRSYTIDTIDQLKRIYPEGHYIVAFSDDLIGGLSQWKEIIRLCNETTMICMTRNPVHPKTPYNVKFFENPITSVSSTEIRDKIKQGQSISDLVPKSVEQYIIEQHLYL